MRLTSRRQTFEMSETVRSVRSWFEMLPLWSESLFSGWWWHHIWSCKGHQGVHTFSCRWSKCSPVLMLCGFAGPEVLVWCVCVTPLLWLFIQTITMSLQANTCNPLNIRLLLSAHSSINDPFTACGSLYPTSNDLLVQTSFDTYSSCIPCYS